MTRINNCIAGGVHSRMIARCFLFAFHFVDEETTRNENRECLFNDNEENQADGCSPSPLYRPAHRHVFVQSDF